MTMKKLILLFLLISAVPCLCEAALGRGRVGSAKGSDGVSSLSYDLTGGSTTAGSCIVVAVFSLNGYDRAYAVTDSAGNLYQSSYSWTGYANVKQLIFYSTNTAPASRITVTTSGWEQFNSCALEITGAAAGNPIDKVSTEIYNNDYWNADWTANQATGELAQADEMILVTQFNSYMSDAVTSYSATGYTQDAIINGCCLMDKIVSSTASSTPSGTATVGAGDYRILTGYVTIKAGASTPQPSPCTSLQSVSLSAGVTIQ